MLLWRDWICREDSNLEDSEGEEVAVEVEDDEDAAAAEEAFLSEIEDSEMGLDKFVKILLHTFFKAQSSRSCLVEV